MYVAIEGNIGAGKSTVIEKLRPKYKCSLEPVKECREKGGNMLAKLYEDPKKFAFIFQLNALLAVAKCKYVDFSLQERSIYSAFKVFTKTLYENGNLNQYEFEVLKEYYEYFKSQNDKPAFIIYLRLPPKMAYDRLVKRNRSEEINIGLDYIVQIHENYEEAFVRAGEELEVPIFIIDATHNHDFVRDIVESLLEAQNKGILGNLSGIREIKRPINLTYSISDEKKLWLEITAEFEKVYEVWKDQMSNKWIDQPSKRVIEEVEIEKEIEERDIFTTLMELRGIMKWLKLETELVANEMAMVRQN